MFKKVENMVSLHSFAVEDLMSEESASKLSPSFWQQIFPRPVLSRSGKGSHSLVIAKPELGC